MQLIRSLAVIALALAAGWYPYAAAMAQDAEPRWQSTGGGPLRQGYSRYKLPRHNDSLWRITLPGAGIHGSSPVVDSQQRIFTITSDRVSSTPLSVLYCLERTGNVYWQQQLADDFDFQPVLLSSGNVLLYSVTKQLYVFSPTGEFLWRRQYSASPRIGEDERWANYASGLDVPTQVQALPDRAGGVLVVDDSPALLSVDSKGDLRWETRLFGSCAGGLMLLDGLVYVPACDGRIHVYSAADGQEHGPLLLGGVCPTYPTGLPGGVLSLSRGGLGERVVLLPYPRMTAFNYVFESGWSLSTALTVNARSQYVVGMGMSGTVGGQTPTRGQLVGLDAGGRMSWSREFSTMPSGQIIADASGRYCFGTEDLGYSGVYQLNPKRGVEWWFSTRGATEVFPIDDGLLGVLIVTLREDRSDIDKNQCEIIAIGD